MNANREVKERHRISPLRREGEGGWGGGGAYDDSGARVERLLCILRGRSRGKEEKKKKKKEWGKMSSRREGNALRIGGAIAQVFGGGYSARMRGPLIHRSSTPLAVFFSAHCIIVVVNLRMEPR